MKKTPVAIYFMVSALVIIVDQVVKYAVQANMTMGSRGQIKIFDDWFKLHYLTNPGMAFGMELPFDNAKVILTIFRLAAMFAIGYYLHYMYKKGAANGLMICMGLKKHQMADRFYHFSQKKNRKK